MLPSHQLHQIDNLTPWLSITPGEEFCYRCDTSSSFTTSVILGTTLYNMIIILVHIFPQFCFKKFAANLFSCINLSYICVGCFWSNVVGRFARLYFLLINLLILADFFFEWIILFYWFTGGWLFARLFGHIGCSIICGCYVLLLYFGTNLTCFLSAFSFIFLSRTFLITSSGGFSLSFSFTLPVLL